MARLFGPGERAKQTVHNAIYENKTEIRLACVQNLLFPTSYLTRKLEAEWH